MKRRLASLTTICLLFCACTAAGGEKPELTADSDSLSDMATAELTIVEAEKGLLYHNPQPLSNVADPCVIDGGDGFYYLFVTSDFNGYYCYKSTDLVNWYDKQIAYSGSDSWGERKFWAPEVVENNGQYYLFYTAEDDSLGLRIGAAKSAAPAGPYIDMLDKPLFDYGYAAIDADVFIEENAAYIYFSKDCSENIVNGKATSEIYGARLNDDFSGIADEPVLLLTPEQMWECASGNTLWNEAPEMIRYNNHYYLTYSANYYGSASYSVGYAISDSPLGSFVKSEQNPILSSGSFKNISGTGHHCFIENSNGELFALYHSHTYPSSGGNNRQMNVDRAVFSENGELYINGPLVSPQPLPENSYTAIAGSFYSGDELAAALSDDIITIHKKDSDYDYCGKDGAELIFHGESAENISGISFYKGTEDVDFTISVEINNAAAEVMITSENRSERSVDLFFAPQKADEVVIKISGSFCLSEIKIWTK